MVVLQTLFKLPLLSFLQKRTVSTHLKFQTLLKILPFCQENTYFCLCTEMHFSWNPIRIMKNHSRLHKNNPLPRISKRKSKLVRGTTKDWERF